MPETWTLTPTAENPREFDNLLLSTGESTCNVRRYERRCGMCGVFAIIVEGKTANEREVIRWKLQHLGLRCITPEEQEVLVQDILLPGQKNASPTLPGTPSPDEDVSRFENEGGRTLS